MFTQETKHSGFPYLQIDNQAATAKIALQGGHLFHYQQSGKDPLLWLSNKSLFTLGKPIRGGIPLCWPWFGKHPTDSKLPQHGFARTSLFKLVTVNEPDAGTTEVILELKSDDKSLKLWPHHFLLELRIVIAAKLTITLSCRNCDTTPFKVSSALHSYFAVSHIDHVSVLGLEDLPFLDFLNQRSSLQQGRLHINRETDRGYQNVKEALRISDQSRTIQIRNTGSRSCVIWNPWIEKSRQMADMPDEAYLTMLCLETANIYEDARTVEAGSKHSLHVEIT